MKRKIKKFPIIIIICTILLIIATIITIKIINHINYTKTYDYKLKQIGYSEEEIISLKKLENKDIDKILTMKYNENLVPIINEKYFLIKNLDKYLDYIKDNKDIKLHDIIAIINVGANKDWYTDFTNTDLTKNELMLTNKFNKLNEDYEPDDLVEISNVYSYGENQKLRLDAYNAFIEMFNAAKLEDITLIINSSYRSFKDQDETYNDYSTWYGQNEADKIAARPGFSEHQTGLSIDIQTYNSTRSNFEETQAFDWLYKNAYKYGFILRYPKDLEYLTGYDYESWHYRYVGKDVAKYIYENNITFDEYYAYFIEK